MLKMKSCARFSVFSRILKRRCRNEKWYFWKKDYFGATWFVTIKWLALYEMTMSEKRNTKSVREAKKAFCKICYDSGRSAAVYESHYVRMWPGDEDAPITCPWLQANRCRRCREQGHTSSFCKSSNIPSSLPERMGTNVVHEKLLTFEEWRTVWLFVVRRVVVFEGREEELFVVLSCYLSIFIRVTCLVFYYHDFTIN